jgi:hypothetical protein
VIKFLVAEGEKSTCIHKCLRKVCDEETVDVHPVPTIGRMTKKLKQEEHDKP